MITRVQVKNFRSIAEADVELGPLTVLVGKNGSGKTSFIDVMRFVRDALTVGLDNAIVNRHGITSLRRWAPRKPYDVDIALTIEGKAVCGEYGFTIASGQEGAYSVKREFCRVGQTLDEVSAEFEVRGGKWVKFPEGSVNRPPRGLNREIDPTNLSLSKAAFFAPAFSRLRQILRACSFYSIFPNNLREPQKPAAQDKLSDHGENLASTLRHVRKRPWYQDLINSLDHVAGGVNDIRVRPVGGFLVTELKHKVGDGHSPWFELDQESDGTLRMLGLAVALYQNSANAVVAIEEPELSLHPGALGVLSDLLHEAATRSQVVVTTQSPDLIARFKADDLRVVDRVDGVTEIGPVAEAQRQTINEQLFSAGDLLRIEGLRREVPLGNV